MMPQPFPRLFLVRRSWGCGSPGWAIAVYLWYALLVADSYPKVVDSFVAHSGSQCPHFASFTNRTIGRQHGGSWTSVKRPPEVGPFPTPESPARGMEVCGRSEVPPAFYPKGTYRIPSRVRCTSKLLLPLLVTSLFPQDGDDVILLVQSRVSDVSRSLVLDTDITSTSFPSSPIFSFSALLAQHHKPRQRNPNSR
jgi:hypothetical protein